VPGAQPAGTGSAEPPGGDCPGGAGAYTGVTVIDRMDNAMATTAEDVWALLRELIEAQKETERRFQETDQRFQETERVLQETSREVRKTTLENQKTSLEVQKTSQEVRKTDRQIKELGKQIGGLGEKFGSFTEGLALPSMEKILRKRFGMEVVSPRVRVTREDRHMEIDVLAYTNSEINAAYVVEVKSHLREEAIDQLKRILVRFREFFPEHRDKRLYGILAAVDVSPELRERVLREGIYVARIRGEIFALDVPEGFEPKVY
jgi:hypothetical protein